MAWTLYLQVSDGKLNDVPGTVSLMVNPADDAGSTNVTVPEDTVSYVMLTGSDRTGIN
jgi:hypothetical protein